ncbi:hypothetical protein ACFQY0_10105 [Haloferula chungangensis]|uniref:HEAT repeat domain-containing protein n=1 Tax=Haloferula chungangensis TaxID=1048331 RepID=A0ABW2L589_9BACT
MKPASQLLLPLAAFAIGFAVYGKLATSSRQALSVPIEARELPDPKLRSLILSDLRNGNPATARERLSKLAGENPLEFFRFIHQHPWLDGLESAVEEASAKLTWNDEDSFKALNLIQNHQLKVRAWQAYIRAAVGTIDDRAIVDVALHAKPFGRQLLYPLFKEAVVDRPKEILKILSENAIERDSFFDLLVEVHPGTFDELLASLHPGNHTHTSDLFSAADARAREARDFGDLSASLSAHGERGWYATETASWLTAIALRESPPEGRASIYDGLATQPDLVRNRTLMDAGSQANIPPNELATVLGLVTSNEIREQILVTWINNQAQLPSHDSTWISELPSHELQQIATDCINRAVPDPP